MYHMKTATVRDLRNHFAKVSRWIRAGEEVEITRRGEVMARLVPTAAISLKKGIKPDFAARRKATSGGKVLRGNSVLLMRRGSKW
jgi:prevent-host-death family protein